MKKILIFSFLLFIVPKIYSQNNLLDSLAVFAGTPDSLPHFKNTIQDWWKFLEKTLIADIPAQNGAPAGRYKPVISFIVNEDGSLSDIKIERDDKYKTGEESLRVMKLSPPWQPAIYQGRPVKYRFQ